MRISNELRVGIMFFVGLVLLVLLIATMTRWGQDRSAYAVTIRFKQAQGIQPGADVRVAGVKVGQVSAVNLDSATNLALVTVRIAKDVQLYQGYNYSIGIGGLVGERYIEIRPTTARTARVTKGSTVDGTDVADMNELIVNANAMISKLSDTATSINNIIGDQATQQNLKATVADLRKTAASSALIAAGLQRMTARNQGAVDLIVADLRDVSGDIRRVSDTLSPQLEQSKMLANLEVASANAALISQRLERVSLAADTFLGDGKVADDLRESLGSLRRASGELEGILASTRESVAVLPAVTANVEKASAMLPAVTANIQQASADLPEITRPFKEVAPQAARDIQSISQQLRQTSEHIGGIAQQVSNAGAALSNLHFEPDVSMMTLTDAKTNPRSDLNLNLRGTSSLFRLGIADLGGENSLNAQAGTRLQSNLWLRYGLVQSHLGIGADYQMTPNLWLNGEVFDPDRLRANALAQYRLRAMGPGWWLTSGWYDLFDHASFGAGVTYRP